VPLHGFDQTLEFTHRGLSLLNQTGKVFGFVGRSIGDFRQALRAGLDVFHRGIQVCHYPLQIAHRLVRPGEEVGRLVRQAGVGEQLAHRAFALFDAGGDLLQPCGELIEMLTGFAEVRAKLGPGIKPACRFLQYDHGLASDFLNGRFERALKLVAANNGSVPFQQWRTLAASNLKERIARHAKFLFYSGR